MGDADRPGLALPATRLSNKVASQITRLATHRIMNPQEGSGGRLGRAARAALAALALANLAVLVVALRLEPDPRGHGTHEQIGLGPCAFLATTGRPCPSCGMTTSFAWFVRGRPDRSWGANPAGALIAPTCLASIPWLLAASIRGRPAPFRSPEQPLVVVSVALVALTLLSWTARMTLWRALG